MDDLVGSKRAAEILSVSKQTIAALCQRRQLPHYKIGKLLKFSRTELLEWLAAQHVDIEETSL